MPPVMITKVMPSAISIGGAAATRIVAAPTARPAPTSASVSPMIQEAVRSSPWSDAAASSRPGSPAALRTSATNALALALGTSQRSVQRALDELAAADKVQAGDILLTANGTELNTTDDLLAVRDALDVGESILFQADREGACLEYSVRLVEQYELNQ